MDRRKTIDVNILQQGSLMSVRVLPLMIFCFLSLVAFPFFFMISFKNNPEEYKI